MLFFLLLFATHGAVGVAISSQTLAPTSNLAARHLVEINIESKGPLNVGAIAGGVIGGVVALLAVVFLMWFVRRTDGKTTKTADELGLTRRESRHMAPEDVFSVDATPDEDSISRIQPFTASAPPVLPSVQVPRFSDEVPWPAASTFGNTVTTTTTSSHSVAYGNPPISADREKVAEQYYAVSSPGGWGHIGDRSTFGAVAPVARPVVVTEADGGPVPPVITLPPTYDPAWRQ